MPKQLKHAGAVLATALAIWCASSTAAEHVTAPAQRGGSPSEGGSAPADPIGFAALDRLIGDAQFVIFGEDSHRMPAVHELVGAVFRHLVEEQAFRNFGLETYWGDEEVLNGSLEPAAFASRFGRRAALIDLKDPAATAGLPTHVPGKLFPQYHKQMPIGLDHVVLDTNLDGIIYLPDAERLP